MKALYILLVSILLIAPSYAQEIYKVLQNESSITIKGTSSVHDWESTVEVFKGSASFITEDGALISIDALNFSVVTESIKSGKRIMDNKTKGALEAKKHPKILFKFESIEEVVGDSLTINGSLTLAGVSNEISLTGSYQVGTNGVISVSGVQNINMEDYGIKPPTAMMGTLKTGKEVDIEFNVTFSNN
ncbi:MAG: hypothetical protein BalsKO_09410 [Balneolaceae bacterium]